MACIHYVSSVYERGDTDLICNKPLLSQHVSVFDALVPVPNDGLPLLHKRRRRRRRRRMASLSLSHIICSAFFCECVCVLLKFSGLPDMSHTPKSSSYSSLCVSVSAFALRHRRCRLLFWRSRHTEGDARDSASRQTYIRTHKILVCGFDVIRGAGRGGRRTHSHHRAERLDISLTHGKRFLCYTHISMRTHILQTNMHSFTIVETVMWLRNPNCNDAVFSIDP